VLYVTALLVCVIVILLWKVSRDIKKTVYFEASYNTGSETVRSCCETCRFWQPSELLPHNAKDSGECLHSPEAWLLQHVIVRLDMLANRDTPKGGYFHKKFTCGMYEPSKKTDSYGKGVRNSSIR